MTDTSNTSQTILVTGGTGFAGQHLLRHLLDLGFTNIHTTTFGNSPLPEVCQDTHVHVHSIDLTKKEDVSEYIKDLQPDQVYHLASFAAVGKSFERAEGLLQNNIMLQLFLLQAIQEHVPHARVLIIGSAEEYGKIPAEYEGKKIDEKCPLNPVNPYAVTKVTQDLLANSFYLSLKMNVIRVRPFNHIGEGQTVEFVVPAFASQIVAIEHGHEHVIRVGNLESVRDFTDVKDMTRAYITVMLKGKVGEVYNIGSGQGWKISEVLDMLCKHSTTEVKIEVDKDRLRPSDIAYFVADATKVQQLGWKPEIPLEETVQRILNEWRKKL